jgi:hypothetical protein
MLKSYLNDLNSFLFYFLSFFNDFFIASIGNKLWIKKLGVMDWNLNQIFYL